MPPGPLPPWTLSVGGLGIRLPAGTNFPWPEPQFNPYAIDNATPAVHAAGTVQLRPGERRGPPRHPRHHTLTFDLSEVAVPPAGMSFSMEMHEQDNTFYQANLFYYLVNPMSACIGFGMALIGRHAASTSVGQHDRVRDNAAARPRAATVLQKGMRP